MQVSYANGTMQAVAAVSGTVNAQGVFTPGSSGGGATAAPFTPSAASGAGTIATANANQVAVAANAARRFLSIANTDASASITYNVVGLAYAGAALVGITLLPGDSYEFPPNCAPGTALNIASATVGAKYFLTEG